MITSNIITSNIQGVRHTPRQNMITSNQKPKFGLAGELIVSIPDHPPFFSLYADGLCSRKTYLKNSQTTLLAYPQGAVVALFYTYPAHRAASLIRNVPGTTEFPGLSLKVKSLFTVHASKVDTLRRALAFLRKNSGCPFLHDDGFYTRLYLILLLRGKLHYPALLRIAPELKESY